MLRVAESPSIVRLSRGRPSPQSQLKQASRPWCISKIITQVQVIGACPNWALRLLFLSAITIGVRTGSVETLVSYHRLPSYVLWADLQLLLLTQVRPSARNPQHAAVRSGEVNTEYSQQLPEQRGSLFNLLSLLSYSHNPTALGSELLEPRFLKKTSFTSPALQEYHKAD